MRARKALRARQVMYKAPGHALDSGKGQTKAALAAEKDEVAKRFAGALIIRTDGAIRAPVVTLQGEKAICTTLLRSIYEPTPLLALNASGSSYARCITLTWTLGGLE